ncbi:hypothetical protein GF382_00815 [Candidatus Falkowbacteria bacterium]|nr:hypothetical protein [Candidatus Falkowbacteria bacterium]
MKGKILSKIIIFFLFMGFVLLPLKKGGSFLSAVKEDYPKLANYYLKYEIPNSEVDNLAKWDVLVLDMEVQHNSPENLKKIRMINPSIIILAYITSQEIRTDIWNDSYAELRSKLFSSIENDWWLRDLSGGKISFWPGTNMLNMTNSGWADNLPRFLKDNVLSTGLWDGVFYDNLWPDVAWLNDGNLDLDNNGSEHSSNDLDKKWRSGYIEMLKRSQELFGGRYLIVGNSKLCFEYQPYINGIMLESFPSHWENGGTWSGSMETYSSDISFRNPKIMIINSNMNNSWNNKDYRKMRFSLGSSLLGDGFFSFDYGTNDHAQTWWYDEYETQLGKAMNEPYNLLDKNSSAWKPGVWRRDFENGVVVVNSTKQDQAYVFDDEVFEKINGTQDRRINNGSKVNMVAMMGEDAVVMLRTVDFKPVVVSQPSQQEEPQSTASDIIKNKGFNNGAFVRVFNEEGRQVRNGFFTYKEDYPGSAQVLITDIDNDGGEEELVNYRGVITVYKNGNVISRFQPYDGKFAGEISFAVADLDGDAVKEIITGAGRGGGPHVRVFNKEGKPLIGGFFAYDQNFRGGVNIAVMDLNGDGTKEIITGAGTGGGPHIRVFSKDGAPLIGGFFAFDSGFRSGVRIAIGNVDGRGELEIIAGAGPGESPRVRIFTKDGNLKKEFNAYSEDMKDGIMVIAADLNGDNKDEILAGSLNY